MSTSKVWKSPNKGFFPKYFSAIYVFLLTTILYYLCLILFHHLAGVQNTYYNNYRTFVTIKPCSRYHFNRNVYNKVFSTLFIMSNFLISSLLPPPVFTL